MKKSNDRTPARPAPLGHVLDGLRIAAVVTALAILGAYIILAFLVCAATTKPKLVGLIEPRRRRSFLNIPLRRGFKGVRK